MRDVETAVVDSLRRAGLKVRRMPAPFPQPRRLSESVGSSIAVSCSMRPMERPVARLLPGALSRLRVGSTTEGFRCRVVRNRLVAAVGETELACLPPKRFLRNGARVPAWWFSAYEELGGGTPWHDGLDDNGTYFWTIDGLRKNGRAERVVPMGFSRTLEFGEHPLRPRLREILGAARLLEEDALTLYWNLLPCADAPSPLVAALHLPVTPEEAVEALPRAAAALARAKRLLDRSRDFRAIWTYGSPDRKIFF